MTPEAQRILVEQRGEQLRAAISSTRRPARRGLKLVIRRRARRVRRAFRRTVTA